MTFHCSQCIFPKATCFFVAVIFSGSPHPTKCGLSLLAKLVNITPISYGFNVGKTMPFAPSPSHHHSHRFLIKTIPSHCSFIYYSLWIQSYLLRKWDWGMIWRVICTFSDSEHGFIGIVLLWNSPSLSSVNQLFL